MSCSSATAPATGPPRRLHDGAGGSTTLAAFFEQIDVLGESADERGQDILGALVDYATQIAPERD